MATKNKGQRPIDKGAMPGTACNRLEKSRKLAQKRRETYKDLMTGIVESLPFSREVLSQLDYNSRLRLALCFLKMKSLLENPQQDSPKMIEASPHCKPVVFQPGVLQELMIEAMDGFLMVMLSDGSIVYLSESIQKHLGLFQSEHMGASLYDLVLEEDHNDVKQALSSAEIKAHTQIGARRVSVPCSFFCRMKCSRNKVSNTQSISPGFKVVHTSGQFRLNSSEAYLVALVKPVTPPSILEIRMEGNMFVTHYSLDMKCIFFDGRLYHLMGYIKSDLETKPIFDFHHHDDTEATMECSKGVQARGEGISGYYRMLTKHGTYVWLQSRATIMFDSQTSAPSYIAAMNFVINKEKGLQALEAKKALPPPAKSQSFISEEKSKAHDPFPIPREDGKEVNPFSGDSRPPLEKSPDEHVMVEMTSPPTDPSSKEPSSTTCPPGGPKASVPPQDKNLEGSRLPSDGNRDDDSVLPSSSVVGLEGVGDGDSGECVPDSTTMGAVGSEKELARRNNSGYNSRMESVSSSEQVKSQDSSGPSLTTNPSVDDTNNVFSGGVSSSSSDSIHTITRSGSRSDPPFADSCSTVYEEPVIELIDTDGTLSHSHPQQQTATSQVLPTVHFHSDQQPLGHHGNQHQPLSHHGNKQQPLSHHGNQQQPLSHHESYAHPTISSSQVSVGYQIAGQPAMKQEMTSMPRPPPACLYSNPPGVDPARNGDGFTFQYQIPGQPPQGTFTSPDFSFGSQHQQQQFVQGPSQLNAASAGFVSALPAHQGQQYAIDRNLTPHQAPSTHQTPSSHQSQQQHLVHQAPSTHQGPMVQQQGPLLHQQVVQSPYTHYQTHQTLTAHQAPIQPTAVHQQHLMQQTPPAHLAPVLQPLQGHQVHHDTIPPHNQQPGTSYRVTELATGFPPNPTYLQSSTINPQSLPSFSSVNQPYTHKDSPTSYQAAQQAGSAGGPYVSAGSTPLTHPQIFPTPTPAQVLFGMDVMGTGCVGHMTTPGLANLTDEDLQILEFIDQLDASGGSVRQIPTAHPGPSC